MAGNTEKKDLCIPDIYDISGKPAVALLQPNAYLYALSISRCNIDPISERLKK